MIDENSPRSAPRSGRSRHLEIRDAAELRVKESDRIAAVMASVLRASA
ncbi:MAG: hypothetical protein R3B99_35445 [Polyangiales bacterium]